MMGLTAGRMFGIGGTSPWRDVAELFLLGCGNVQVCTATMHNGYRSVEDMANGLLNWMSEKGFRNRHRLQPVQGLADMRQRMSRLLPAEQKSSASDDLSEQPGRVPSSKAS